MDHPFLFFFGDIFIFFKEDFLEIAFIIKISVLDSDFRLIFVEFGIRFFVRDIIYLDTDCFISTFCAGFLEVGFLNSRQLSVHSQRGSNDCAVIKKDRRFYCVSSGCVDQGSCPFFSLDCLAGLVCFR